ncbi:MULTISPECIES: TolC family protein [Stenotrophomonas]|jgi:outer membrane protein TolC|uniref:TolC family protein n=1 Tax=Stenotrophomonas maltophilia TaxID=40324 RepID=A0A4S2CRY2_STEMA|nr:MULTISPECIES: TolC family protein [Stenotrophomonas]TGY31035.1 TolC family protein [Stenotrophomonas maltophilia]
MNPRRHRLAATLLAWLPAIAAAQATYLPPDELIANALMAQPEVQAASARAVAARAEARALAAGSYEYEASVIPQRRTTDASGDYSEWEAQVGRRIRLPGKARLDREIGLHGTTAADLRLDDAEHQAARRLLALWMDWLRTAQVAGETAQQQALMTRERDALARRVQLGDAARRELDLFEAERAQLQALALAAQAAAEAARQALAGQFPQIPLPERVPELPDPASLPGGAAPWRALIVERSHEIGIAVEDATRQSLVADRARADRRPDPSVGVRVMNDRGGAERAIGLVLSVPIGYTHRSALAASESANALAMAAEADGMRRMIGQEAWATVQAAESRLAQWQAQRVALAAQTTATRRTRRAWELGETALGEYLLALRSEHQVRLAEAQARVDALEAGLLVRVDSHELWHPELPGESHEHAAAMPRGE